MTGWIILLSISVVIFVLLCLPVSLKANFENSNLSAVVKLAGVKVWSYPGLKQSDDEQNKTKNVNPIKQIIDEKGLFSFIKFVLSFALSAIKRLAGVIKHIRIKILVLDGVVAGEDAAQTAIMFGEISAVFYPFVNTLESLSKIAKRKYNLSADFDGTESTFSGSISASVALVHLLRAVVLIVFDYIKFNHKEGETNNERK